MVVQNTHSDISNKNRELIAENKNMIDAISNAYIALLEINITTGLVLPISLPSTFSSKYIKNWQNYDVIKDEFINNFVDEKDKDKIMEFIDGYTLNERLKGKRFISKLYNGINGEKREIVYSVSKRDKDGNVLELFLSISGKDE